MAGAVYYKKHNVVYVSDIYGHLCCNYKVYYSKKYRNSGNGLSSCHSFPIHVQTIQGTLNTEP